MRAMSVVVAGELSQDLTETLLAEDQDVIQALAPERAHEPLRIGITPGDFHSEANRTARAVNPGGQER